MDLGILDGSQRYEFKGISKWEAQNMWACDILNGEMIKIKLNKGHRKVQKPINPKRPNKIPGVMVVSYYWVQSRKNWFYLPAKNATEAKEKFEAQFLDVAKQLEERTKNNSTLEKNV